MADTWITTDKASKLSGYTANHIRILIREGRIKGRKYFVIWQVSRQSLEAFVREQQKKGEKRGRKPFT